MDRKLKLIISCIFVIFILVGLSLIFLFQDEPNAEEIKGRFIDSVGSVEFYKYTINIRTIRSTENISGVNISDSNITSTGKIDILNKKLSVEHKLKEDSLQNQDFIFINYYEDEIFYYPWGENKWYSSELSNNWYVYSYIERLAYFLLEDAVLEKLQDEKIKNNYCYVLNIKPVFKNVQLTNASGDSLFGSGLPEKSYENLTLKCWFDKDDYLLKRFFVKYDVDISSFYYDDENITNVIQSYDIDIQFYDYNKPITIIAPWQHFIDEAEEKLNSLNYSSIKYGYGFNLSEKWTGWIYHEDDTYGNILSQFLYRKNVDSNNLSLIISPPSEHDSSSLNYKVLETLERIDNDNYTLISNQSRTMNNMNAYEIAYSTINDDSETIIIKEIYVENNERVFEIFYGGLTDLYNLYESEIEQSLNTSFTIISPYYQIT